MKVFCLLLLLMPGLMKAYAQHCPFDGGEVIVVRLKDKTGKPVNDSSFRITLVENHNSYADSCTYASGLLQVAFTSIEKGWIERYANSWKNTATHLLKETDIKTEQGYRAVVLNQAQADCMIKNGNDFIYRERNYTIQVSRANDILQTIAVQPDRKYKLCTSAGKWSRIKPIAIIIE